MKFMFLETFEIKDIIFAELLSLNLDSIFNMKSCINVRNTVISFNIA